MRGVADLQHGMADREQAAHREIAHAEIEVDVELVAGQRHPVRPARDQLGHPGVHHRHLPLRVSRPVRHARAAAGEPIVPGKPGHGVEQRLARQLPHTDRRAADHQDDPATIPGRITDLAKPRFEALTRQMLHDPILTGHCHPGQRADYLRPGRHRGMRARDGAGAGAICGRPRTRWEGLAAWTARWDASPNTRFSRMSFSTMPRAGSSTPITTGRPAWRCWETSRASGSLTPRAARACTPGNWFAAGRRSWVSTTARAWCRSAGRGSAKATSGCMTWVIRLTGCL